MVLMRFGKKAESALAGALEKIGKSYKLNPGDGAFYGPKLDFKIKDAIGRIIGNVELSKLELQLTRKI